MPRLELLEEKNVVLIFLGCYRDKPGVGSDIATRNIPCSDVVLILPFMHHHLHVQCVKTCTHPWYRAIGYTMKKISTSDSVLSCEVAGLSEDIIREMCHQKSAPLNTRPWDILKHRMKSLAES